VPVRDSTDHCGAREGVPRAGVLGAPLAWGALPPGSNLPSVALPNRGCTAQPLAELKRSVCERFGPRFDPPGTSGSTRCYPAAAEVPG